MSKVGFIPSSCCTVASGDCFTFGKCLGNCHPKLPKKDANENLQKALILLEKLTQYTILNKSTTKYVAGSNIDISVRQSQELIAKLSIKQNTNGKLAAPDSP